MSENESGVKPYDKRDKWLSAIIWLGLLAAVLLTSYAALSIVTAGGLLSVFSSALSNTNGLGSALGRSSGLSVTAIINGLFGVVISVWLATAWMRFIALSRSLIVSYAWLEEQTDESTIFSDLLISAAAPQEANTPVSQADLDNVDKTILSEVIRYLAYAWIALLVMSPVGLIASVLFQ